MHPHLPETEATLMFKQMTYIDAYINFISVTCNPHNPKTTIGRYQRTNQPIPIIGKTADNRPILILSVHTDRQTHRQHLTSLLDKLNQLT